MNEKIASALQRRATADTRSIRVDSSGGKVTLTGTASSWQSIDDAANAAWTVPGVIAVVSLVTLVRGERVPPL